MIARKLNRDVKLVHRSITLRAELSTKTTRIIELAIALGVQLSTARSSKLVPVTLRCSLSYYIGAEPQISAMRRVHYPSPRVIR